MPLSGRRASPWAGTLLAIGAVLAAFAGRAWAPRGAAGRATAARRTPFAGAELIPLTSPGLREPSGIAYHAARDRLFVVSDRGALAELDGEGRVLRLRAVKGDLEDIAVHEPSGDLLLLSERKPRIIRVDARSLVEVARCHVDRAALVGGGRGKRRTHGFEGIAFRRDAALPGGGALSLTHQEQPAAVLTLVFDPLACGAADIGADALRSRWDLRGHGSLTGLTYAAPLGRYLVIDGARRELLVMRTDGESEASLPLPGLQPEGVCLDARGTLWVADDRQGVWRVPGALEVLRSRLAASPSHSD